MRFGKLVNLLVFLTEVNNCLKKDNYIMFKYFIYIRLGLTEDIIMAIQYFGGLLDAGRSYVQRKTRNYVSDLLIVPSFENGDTIKDFQKYSAPALFVLGDDVMKTSLFSFKADADKNKDGNLTAAELTVWLKNNSALKEYICQALGVTNVSDEYLLKNWDSLKSKLPFDVSKDALQMINKALDYMDIQNTTFGDVLTFTNALMHLDKVTDGNLTRKVFSVLEQQKQGNLSNRDALNAINNIFQSFAPCVYSADTREAVETVIHEIKKNVIHIVGNETCGFLGGFAGRLAETYLRKQAGLDVGVLQNLEYKAVKCVATGLKTYSQLEEMRYEQDKGKSTTYRAMSGAAWGFRLR